MIKVLSDVYPTEVPPVRDGKYLHRIEHYDADDTFSLREYRNGCWRKWNGAPISNHCTMYWMGLAFDPLMAVPEKQIRATARGLVYLAGAFVPEAVCVHTIVQRGMGRV